MYFCIVINEEKSEMIYKLNTQVAIRQKKDRPFSSNELPVES